MEYTHHYNSILGGITVASDGDAISGLWFDSQKHFAAGLDPDHAEASLPVFEEVDRWLDIYFSGRQPDFMPALSMKASPFRKAVWEVLLTIPYGQTVSYGKIAEIIADSRGIARMSAQAVGGAVGHNPISIIVPCHRVVGSDGSLIGYAGGIDRKIKLLTIERADTASLCIPEKYEFRKQ